MAETALFTPPFPPRRDRPIGALGMLLALRRNPIEIWSKADFERPFSMGRSIIGQRAAVHEPEGVRRVFLDNAANYRKDALQLRVLAPGLGNGLLTADGEEWRAQRRALAPLFSPREVAGFAVAMQDVAAATAARIAARRDGAVCDVCDLMSRLALDVLERTLFSQGLGDDPGAFQVAVTRYFQTFGQLDPLDLVGAPDFLPRIGRWRGRSTLAFFDRAVERIIQRRREVIAAGGEPPRDLLTLLLKAQDPHTGRAMPDADVRANIVTFIGAGHETTANGLTWALYLLSQAPEWRARAEAEADSLFDAQNPPASADKLEIVRAVFEEALRLYPPAAILSRQAISDDVICGRSVPAGTIVTVSPYVLHRRRGLWENPDAFDPSRFLGAARERIDRFAYIPFGAGPRVCIGMAFAMQEGIIALANLLRALRFDLVAAHPVAPQQRVTLRPRDGMKMHARRRASSESPGK